MTIIAALVAMKCNHHHNHDLCLYCETYDESICQDCIIIDHRNHKYQFARNAGLYIVVCCYICITYL